jgi:hypothetical protein
MSAEAAEPPIALFQAKDLAKTNSWPTVPLIWLDRIDIRGHHEGE